MNGGSKTRLQAILARLALAETDDQVAQIGRSEMASWLTHASQADIADVVRRARRDQKLRRCLSAARYYSGLDRETCAKIDALLGNPIAPAGRRGRR